MFQFKLEDAAPVVTIPPPASVNNISTTGSGVPVTPQRRSQTISSNK